MKSRNPIVRKVKFSIEYIALNLFVSLLCLLPFNFAVWCAEQFCLLAARFKHKRFKDNIKSIMIALPGTTEDRARQIAAESWKNMGRIMVEFVKFTRMSKEKLLTHFELIGLDKMQKQAESGKGALSHTGHFTNWEAYGLAASAYGLDKAVIAQKTENPYVDKRVNEMRNTFGGRVIKTDESFFTIVRWLKKGKMLGILTDQNSYKSAIFTKFLGRWCATSPMTALLSIKLDIPVFPTKVYRKNKKIVVEVLDPVYPPKDKPFSQEVLKEYVDVLNKYYEDWIKEDPASWLWAHNRWKRGKEVEGKEIS
ncbi:KDO2-lipid IV(A) lauroyltransferase [Parelusimicrobium proximum]|uniref:lysophospholipid acyltransferase family protein n=1 Tax=Parelusimicrobium proximum TaxID=3228953 RepID=UPI003D17793B